MSETMPPDARSDAVETCFALNDVWKSFGGVAALSGASLRVMPREIHALVGENGAGKSTLINIATGVHRPDRGEILIDGRVVQFATPGTAAEHGVAVVHQERNLVRKFSLAENLLLGRQPLTGGIVNHRRMVEEARPWLQRVGLHLDPRAEASHLSPGQAQLLEIAKALSRRCRVLLLDEPTSSITDSEFEHLKALLNEVHDDGTSIVFVSHKLEEVYALCSRITVLRDGRNVLSSAPLADVSQQDIVRAMVGRQVELLAATRTRKTETGRPKLELHGLATEDGHRGIELTLRRGEIVCLYGLVGAGRTELARAIMGLARITDGEMRVDGKPVHIRNPFEALRYYRIGYVSEDRKDEGLILTHSIGRNVGITIWERIARGFGWISDERARPVLSPPLERLKVKMNRLSQPTGSLSGGNQQKVSAAKWIAAEAELLIFDEPTVGIDVAAKDAMHRLIVELAEDGKAILVISSDLHEVVQLADRILVMGDFRLRAELANNGDYAATSERVMQAIIQGGG
ncbi:MAG TPA: sugar ABC transporter ATP-binding protein [Acidisoma sp.]|uniref:sugar ABC transporter ATP-binding protein n=1 Tax=Acidisoma sp. TaxID=1872115 RepID=UPI002CAC1F3F|nr:sugar ABC transporter ATP-binding protein [Acidisoma sp.]HTI00606.1 sugar ABC transporter ATP-binding protein [Acidisoma sp.]